MKFIWNMEKGNLHELLRKTEFKRESSVQFVTNRVHVVLKKRQSKKQNKKEPYGLKLG